MAWYSSIEAASMAVVGAVGVAVGTAFKFRRTLARDNSDIAQEKSDTKAVSWLNDALIEQVTKAQTERDATMRAAKELLDLRMVDVEKIARLEERLANCEHGSLACQDRAQRAETRAAVAEEHMRTQAEQMLVMSMNIDRLTTELARHDPAAAARLTPQPKQQPLLIAPVDEGEA